MQVKNILISMASLVAFVEAQNATNGTSKNAAVGQYDQVNIGNRAAFGALAAGAIAYLL